MAFLLDGNPLAVDVPFTVGNIHYPANWLRLSTAQEKKDIGITEVTDSPVFDGRFYNTNGSAKSLDDTTETIDGIEYTNPGVKSTLKAQEKSLAKGLLEKYDWYVVRKAETSKAIPTAIKTYRTAVRTACLTRETEIDNCADTAALVTLYSSKEDGTPNMTQYPEDPNA
tara:strand:- start:6 stop:512 length:507 start_codon:yes stop_codon:yes gene_type:complete